MREARAVTSGVTRLGRRVSICDVLLRGSWVCGDRVRMRVMFRFMVYIASVYILRVYASCVRSFQVLLTNPLAVFFPSRP